jgi:hypothetical protein
MVGKARPALDDVAVGMAKCKVVSPTQENESKEGRK